MATGTHAREIDQREFEAYRRELTGYCYRMLGSGSEAEDAVQETMLRAWRSADGLAERAAMRSWLYRIATNVCLDMLQAAQRRARPMDLASPLSAESALGPELPETTWIQPIADARVMPETGDPAELAAARETIRLAFVAALQHLPARQRAVLILREVLRWQASEVAELLGMTVASVNSALQRARATLDTLELHDTGGAAVGAEHEELLARYVDTFQRYDIEALVSLIAEDATFTMPPYRLWLRGTADISRWYVGQGIGCKGSRLLATWANGCPAFGAYKPSPNGGWEPFALQVIEVAGDKLVGLHHFLGPALFEEFGLPPRLEADAA
ncbi:MAG: sigma-70 family RNA polymerase sigma factor [Thermoleophilaceae bacterium]